MALARAQVEAWYIKYGAAVLRRARAILGCESLARDALQEIFLQVMRHGDTVRGDVSPMTWIYRVTTHHCIDQLRRNGRDRRWRSATDLASPTYGPTGEAMVLLRQILAHADSREASAAVYVFVDQLTYDEAAPLLGVSKRTVGNLVERFVANARRYAAQEQSVAPHEGSASQSPLCVIAAHLHKGVCE